MHTSFYRPALSAIIVLSAAISCYAQDRTIQIDESSFAAIAYSPSTHTYAYSHSHRSRAAAEEAAVKKCAIADARAVAWVNNGFCALALGDDRGCWGGGYDHSPRCTNRNAINRAIEQCAKRTKGAHAVLCLSSDGQYVTDIKDEPR